MRYATGTITITNGSHVVEGQGTLWKGVARPGNMLWVEGLDRVWQIALVASDTEIALSSRIVCPPELEGMPLRYAVAADFTPHFSMPYPNAGETESASVLKRAFDTLEKEFGKRLFGSSA